MISDVNAPYFMLDSNVFIQAKNLYYQFHFCPGFWSWLQTINGNGAAISLISVYDELVKHPANAGHEPDELSKWAKSHRKLFISYDDPDTINALLELESFLIKKEVAEPKIDQFMKAADSTLIAYAKAHNACVVSHERASKDFSAKKIYMPNVCNAFGVRYQSIFDIMRYESQSKLVLLPQDSVS